MDDDLQDDVGLWGEETFPNATSHSIICHLEKEVKELKGYLLDSQLKEECADCFLLLLHLAHRGRFSLLDEARKKMAINYRRTWGKPDKDGVVEHIRQDAPAIKEARNITEQVQGQNAPTYLCHECKEQWELSQAKY